MSFPFELDISPLTGSEVNAEESKYDLVSVVTHIGRIADSGHYICWSRDPKFKGKDFVSASKCHFFNHRPLVEV